MHCTANDIREHYDVVSVFYRALWGDHIHHGYWEGDEPVAQAQEKLIEKLAEQAGLRRGMRVLDVGCGVGGSSLWLAQEYDCSVLGITISPVQARMAQAQAAAKGLARKVSFEVIDANELPFSEETFDLIWIVECIEHLKDKPAFLKACSRILSPGGSIAICSWARGAALVQERDERILAQICHGMLLPSLPTIVDYQVWLHRCSFVDIRARDVTGFVSRTWDHCLRIVQNPPVRFLVNLSDDRIRDFVGAFEAMATGYETGSLSYAMITAAWQRAAP